MRFSRKHKFILVSNWKCGCSSIAQIFDPYSEFTYNTSSLCKELLGTPFQQLVHWPAYKIRDKFSELGLDYDKYIKITSVRNPWARVVSLFFNKNPNLEKNLSNVRQELRDVMIKRHFTEFVKTELRQWQHGLKNRWNTYEMIHDNVTKKSLVTYVVRLEHFEEDLRPIIAKHFPQFGPINYNTHVNTTSHKHYTHYYTRETRQIVEKMFKYDIERYHYRFRSDTKRAPVKPSASPPVFDID
jgi:chondroitin 4-sulfotransferase 11